MNPDLQQQPRKLLAFIDESGHRAKTARSSDHFVMSAVLIFADWQEQAGALLESLRSDLGRSPGDHLSWKNLRSHADRLHVAQSVGAQQWLRISSVVVCKRYLENHLPSEDHAYLFTLRFLLERLSWFGRTNRAVVTYTLAHIVRFRIGQLRAYEAALRAQRDCNITWAALDPRGGRINQPQRLELLQLGDLAASATAMAFEPDKYGNTETRYLESLAGVLYRRGDNLTSYGLKMHPWNPTTKAAYPWVAAL